MRREQEVQDVRLGHEVVQVQSGLNAVVARVPFDQATRVDEEEMEGEPSMLRGRASMM